MSGKAEYFDGTVWQELNNQNSNNITLEGAVTGSGTGTITTSLNNTINYQSTDQTRSWPQTSGSYIYRDSLVGNGGNFIHVIGSSTGTVVTFWENNYYFNDNSTFLAKYQLIHATNARGSLENFTPLDITIDQSANTQITITGDVTISGGVNVSNNLVSNVATPIAATDAANKDYVDTVVASSAILERLDKAESKVNELSTLVEQLYAIIKNKE